MPAKQTIAIFIVCFFVLVALSAWLFLAPPSIGIADRLGVAKDLLTIFGGVIAGLVAWYRWGREAPAASRANLSQIITVAAFRDHWLVHVEAVIQNTGTVTLWPTEAYTLIQKVAPADENVQQHLESGTMPIGESETEYAWPVIERRDYPAGPDNLQIDSGETERLHAEFLLPREVDVVAIYSLFTLDPEQPDLGWDTTLLCRLSTLNLNPGYRTHQQSNSPRQEGGPNL